MKNQLLIILLCLPFLSVGSTALFMGQESIDPINNVIGDVSYYEAFNESPKQAEDQLRITTHLAYVENELRAKEVSHLSEELQCNRSEMLDLLCAYVETGKFPKNTYLPNERTSVFVDKSNTVCAVGYLVQQSAGQAAIEHINDRFQLASIFDMKDPLLADWVAQSGLTLEECAMIQPTYGGGGIIIPNPPPRDRIRPIDNSMFALELRSNKVQVDITELSATTTFDQVFYNPSSHQLEGYYFFPIPKGASIGSFSMFINGVETKGEVLDAAKARKIYEDIVRRSKDPALLELYNNELFRVRIFPIRPRTEQRVKMTYTETLVKESGTVEYVFPFKHSNYEGVNPTTVSMKVNIKSKDKIKNVYCPTHKAEIIHKNDKHAVVGFEGESKASESDFKVYYSTDNGKVGMSLLSYQKGRERGYFMLNLSPGFDIKQEVIAKDITFVLDASGSMAGEKMEQAQKALKFCIANLNKEDKFNIVRFSTEASNMFENLELATKENRKEAREYIDDLQAIGGTNIDEALEMALAHKKKDGRPHFIIFMTDGKPTIGETQEEALLSKVKKYNAENTRIFTFGIGTKLNTKLLDKLTVMTQSYRTYVLPNEDIEVKLSDFYTKVSSPILTDIKVKFDRNVSIADVQPKELPDMFKGSSMTLMGRYKGSGKVKVTVEGKVNGKKEVFTYEGNLEEKEDKYEFVPSLWASRTVGYLLDQVRLHGESKEVVDEIVRLSKKHGIITPYTSYLILEDEALSVRQNVIRRDQQLLRPRVENDDAFVQSNKVEYKEAITKTEGLSSIDASEEAQTLNEVTVTAAPTRRPRDKKKLKYTNNAGESKDLDGEIVQIQGRAVYNSNNVWIDSNVQLEKTSKTNRIKFGSKDYFKLIEKEPNSADFLALGRNVRFEMNGEIYDIYE